MMNSCPRMLRYRPPRIALTLLLTAGALHLTLMTAGPSLGAAPLGGAVLMLIGFVIMLRAWWLFRKADTAICPTAETTTLVTRDVFRLTRNPMYLGIVLMMFGVAAATGGLPFYVAAAAYFLIIDSVFCPYEEEKLARDFGAGFERYRRQVRRWL